MTNKQRPLALRAIRFLGSVHVAMVLLVAGALAMAVGTLIESRSGLTVARSTVYGTLWFDAFLFLIALNLAVAVANRVPIKRHQWSFVLTHFSIILLLGGAWISRTYGFEGKVPIVEGGVEAALHLGSSEVILGREHPRTFELPETTFLAGRRLQAESATEPALEIVDYVHEGTASTELVEDARGAPGVSLRVRAHGRELPVWLLADHQALRRRDVGHVEIEILRMSSEEQLAARSEPLSSGASHVVIDAGDGTPPVRIPLPDGLQEDVDCGAGVSARVTRFLTHARVESRGLVEVPDAPVNPAAVVEIRRGDELETYTVFALFPEFDLSRGSGAGLVASARLDAVAGTGKPLISILSGPGARLRVQTTTASGRGPARDLARGDLYHPQDDHDLELELVESFEGARPETVVRPAPAGAESIPCIQLAFTRAGERAELWLTRNSTQLIALGGELLEVTFRRRVRPLPFSIQLERFEARYHPGSSRPSAFESHVVLAGRHGAGPSLAAIVAMNRPMDFMGYRIFQSGYVLGEDGAPHTTILSVARDPGVPVVYTAFVLLILGIGWYVVGDGRRSRRNGTTSDEERRENTVIRPERRQRPEVRPLTKRRARVPTLALLATLLLVSTSEAAGGSDRAPELPLEKTRSWAVLSNGRVKPLETHAREMTLAVTGRSSLDNLGPLAIFWGYNLAPTDFAAREYVRVDGLELKAKLGMEGVRRASFDALMQNQTFQGLVEQAFERRAAGLESTQLEREVLDAYERLELVAEMIQGRSLRVVPSADDGAAWVTPDELKGAQGEHGLIYSGFLALATAWREGDSAGFGRAADELGVLLAADRGSIPAASLEREVFYNKLQPFGRAWILYLAAFLVALLFGRGERRSGRVIAIAALAAGLLVHTVGIALRWQIAGHAPVSNMYESLIFMAWGVAAIGLALEVGHRKGYFAMAAGLTGFLTLLFARNLPIDSSINPLVPVLANTSWLSIHVMTIMLSYSAFALAMVMGHISLGAQLFRPGRHEFLRTLSTLLYRTLQVGVLFLAAGICFGAIWANRSWGRYWGWDPKETWSLITFFAYLGLIHARFAGWLQNFGLGAWSILCFLTVLMTYYGVNFLLGTGLHSYGFASGGVLWVGVYLGAELAVIAAATLRYRASLQERVPSAAVRLDASGT